MGVRNLLKYVKTNVPDGYIKVDILQEIKLWRYIIF